MSAPDFAEMTLTEHLAELRTRLIRAMMGIAVGFAVCYGESQRVLDFVLAPLERVLPEDSTIQFTSLPEPFFVHLKVSALAGFFLASPWVFYQLWKFVAPGLYAQEKRMALPFVFLSTLFFTCGSVFCFYYVFPVTFEYFMTFGTADIRPIPKLGEYFSLVTKLLLGFGIVFELPVVCFFLGRMGVLHWRPMVSAWRYITVVIFIVAAILTPPDPVSQVMLAAPLMILYGISVLVVAVTGARDEV